LIGAELGEDEKHFVDSLAAGQQTNLIERRIAETAAFIKHPGFSEEGEWRCALVKSKSDFRNTGRTEDRCSGLRVISYVKLSLGAEGDRYIGVEHIVAGPNADANALSEVTSHLMSTRGMSNFGLISPFNPLR
jgi:hypothetical protein